VIAGGGFAVMAWRLAQQRTVESWLGSPLRFDLVWDHKPSAEYYRICDNATRAASAYRAAYKLGMVSDSGMTVKL
jgi:hypothetical protein